MKSQVIPAIPCKEKYKDFDDASLLEQFEKSAENMTEWLCPDIASFALLNLPQTNNNGKDFKLVVDFCDTSAPECNGEDDGRRKSFLETITINSKLIYQIFDGKTYYNTSKLIYERNSEMNSGLVTGNCIIKEIQVTRNELHILSTKFFDISYFINVGTKLNIYSFWFWNTIIKEYIRVEGETSR